MNSQAKSSVSLKINSTSVMLYRNAYVKAANGLPGMTAQHYVASFSTREPVVPSQFESVLRDLTEGDPSRCRELLERIESKVLAPRRAELARFEAQQVAANALASLDRAMGAIRNFADAWSRCVVTVDMGVQPKIAELTTLIGTLNQTVNSGQPVTPTLGTRISAMLDSIKIVRNMLAEAPSGQDLGLTPTQVSDWKMTYFAFSQARDYAGSHRKIAAKQNWATHEWADEAVVRGFADAEKVEKARAKALAAAKAANRVGRLV